MRVLVAFDKFKDALTAAQACASAARALQERHPDWLLDLCPLADGGDGFCEILTRAARGEIRQAKVSGPRGEQIDAAYGLVSSAKIPRSALALLGGKNPPSRVAVIELAAASGLALLPAASPERQKPVERLVCRILAAKQRDVAKNGLMTPQHVVLSK